MNITLIVIGPSKGYQIAALNRYVKHTICVDESLNDKSQLLNAIQNVQTDWVILADAKINFSIVQPISTESSIEENSYGVIINGLSQKQNFIQELGSTTNSHFLLCTTDQLRSHSLIGTSSEEIISSYIFQFQQSGFRAFEMGRLQENTLFQTPKKYFTYIKASTVELFSLVRRNPAVWDKPTTTLLGGWLSTVFLVIMAVVLPLISVDYGISGDEFVDMRHADLVIDYFTEGNKAALDQPKTTLHLYGNGIQVIAQAINRLFNVSDPFLVRHLLCSLVGWFGLFIMVKLGRRMGGSMTGFLAALLLLLTPKFLGHSMNNLKDIPFAVGYITAIYYFIRQLDHYPKINVKCMCGAVFGIFLAMGTRSGGLLLYPYFMMIAGLYYINRVHWKAMFNLVANKETIVNYLKIVLPTLLFGYIVSILLWPFALESPLTGLLTSLREFTNYSIGLRTLFDGEQMMSTMLPWNYAPKYLLITLPLVVLIGFCCSLIFFATKINKVKILTFFLLFSAIFPVFWVIYQNSNLYGGIRHLLFVIPSIVLLAALGWSNLFFVGNKYMKHLFIAIFLLGVGFPLKHTIGNHPNTYVYFNELQGGIEGAYGDFETDYYYNSLRESSQWFIDNVVEKTDKKIVVVTNHSDILAHYFRNYPQVKVIYSRYYQKQQKKWDYAIFGNVYINRSQLINGYFPPMHTIYQSDVDGFPMSVVVERGDQRELKAYEYFQKNQFKKAIPIYESYLKNDSLSEEVWSKLGLCYYTLKQEEKAVNALEQAIRLHPLYNEALYYRSLIAIEHKQYALAAQLANQILSENKYGIAGHQILMQVNLSQNKYQEAIKNINTILSINPNHPQALMNAGDVFIKSEQYAKAYQLYTKLFKKTNGISTYTKMAKCLLYMGKIEDSVKALEQIYKNDKNYEDAQALEVEQAIVKKNFSVAQQLLNEYAVGKDSPMWNEIRLRLLVAQKDQKAKSLAQEILKADPYCRFAANVVKSKNGLQ